eukprot:gene60793-83149_t
MLVRSGGRGDGEQVVIGHARGGGGTRLQLQHLAFQQGEGPVDPVARSYRGVGHRFLQISYRTRRDAGVKRRASLFRLQTKGPPVAQPSDAPEKATPKMMADAIRVLAMDGVEKANSGHPGMPMGMADVATVLFSKFLKFDASRPDWADRDRFILSAGHGSMLIYALLHLTGYKAATAEQLSNFRQWGSKTAGHPEYGHMPGVETTTGPLGQGLANSIGFAMAERHLAAKYGEDL